MGQKLTTPESEQWATKITTAWRASVDAIIAVGQLLIESKKALQQHGEFARMVRNDLPFSARTAQRLMAVARDERLATHGSLLSPSWRTLYDITRLSDAAFKRGIEDGIIKPEMERSDLVPLLPVPRPPKPPPASLVYRTVEVVVEKREYSVPIIAPVERGRTERVFAFSHRDIASGLRLVSDNTLDPAEREAREIAARLIEDYGAGPVRAIIEAIDTNPLVRDHILKLCVD